MKRTLFIGAVAIVALAGCAKSPASIAPAYVSEIPYQSLSCEQLGAESARVTNALAAASQQQENARGGDIVGIILIGLPVSSMSGDNIAPQIANLKGQQDALQRTMIAKNC
jgi:hypothetical protein